VIKPAFPADAARTLGDVLGVGIDALTFDHALSRIARWASQRESRYVCICNVHSVVTASRDAGFSAVLNGADLATPDGAPVAWVLRRLGHRAQQRVSGPDLMWDYLALAAKSGEPTFLFGSSEQTLQALQARLRNLLPTLNIVGAIAPPFRPATPAEDQAHVDAINQSGATTVWVSLGCPKQEFWMASHRGRVQAVMIGVGAAFDFHAGTVQRAPSWMRDHGLEWLHRLLSEPGRLWKRYLVTNILFLVRIGKQFLRGSQQ
jgi:N-acetylglucosaminyldiphosphoundecaprenol N-acetyl-beta-D-mannosaminyltransferase